LLADHRDNSLGGKQMRTLDRLSGLCALCALGSSLTLLGCSDDSPANERASTVKQPATTGATNPEVSAVPSRPEAEDEFQTEQSMTYTAGEFLVVGYIDLTGMVDRTDPSFPVLVENASKMGVATSSDGGQTWVPQPQISSPDLDPNGPRAINGDPWIATDSAHEHLWYLNMAIHAGFGEGGFFLSESTDDGQTWTEARYIDAQAGGQIDKPSIAVDPLDSNNIYVAFRVIGGPIKVLKSTDGGASFPDPPTVIPYPDETHAIDDVHNPIIRVMTLGAESRAVLSFEDLTDLPLVSIRFAMEDQFGEWHVESVVDGIVPQFITTLAPGQINNEKIIHSMVIDEPRDVCAIVWVDSDGKVTIGATTDGVVWETQQVPEQPQAARWQPQIATNASDETALSQDLLAVTWYEQPVGDPNTSVMGSISDDGGVTWSAPVALTKSTSVGAVPFEHCVDGGNFFGDYTGLTALGDGSSSFAATWADSRRGCISGEYAEELLTAQHLHTVSNTLTR
jgi:hypothetical protein